MDPDFFLKGIWIDRGGFSGIGWGLNAFLLGSILIFFLKIYWLKFGFVLERSDFTVIMTSLIEYNRFGISPIIIGHCA